MSDEEYLRVFGKTRDQMIAKTRAELRSAMKKKDKALTKELFAKFKKAYIGDNIFWANEVVTNIFVATIMAFFCLIMIATMILSQAGVYKFNNDALIPTMNVINAILIFGIVICIYYKGERHWLKYVMMLMLCIVMGALSAFLGFRAVISLSIPVIISTKYYSSAFTKFIAVISGIGMFVGTLVSAFWSLSVDLNYVTLKEGVDVVLNSTAETTVSRDVIAMNGYIHDLLLESFLPNFIQFLLISYICNILAKWSHKMVVDQADTAKEFARVDTELGLARDIQKSMLPNVFPAFPDNKEFDIYGSMDAAKEVGGDFFDYFLIDENHLAIVVADVSDKGVPAALFMMIGKALIKSQAMLGKRPGEVLEIVNNQLCENNDVGLFITAWIGILDIRTGEIVAANAGHEYPAVTSNGECSFVKHRHGFVLAGIEDTKYEEYNIKLNPGDSIFLYTDGVTEATNVDSDMFGKDRILEGINQNSGKEPKELIDELRKNIDAFVGTAKQHDDITMVVLNYRGVQ